jgi:hypothetical protein
LGDSQIRIDPSDRLPHVSVKKRTILTGLGFFAHALNLAGSTASIASTPIGARLIENLRAAVEALWQKISL